MICQPIITTFCLHIHHTYVLVVDCYTRDKADLSASKETKKENKQEGIIKRKATLLERLFLYCFKVKNLAGSLSDLQFHS